MVNKNVKINTNSFQFFKYRVFKSFFNYDSKKYINKMYRLCYFFTHYKTDDFKKFKLEEIVKRKKSFLEVKGHLGKSVSNPSYVKIKHIIKRKVQGKNKLNFNYDIFINFLNYGGMFNRLNFFLKNEGKIINRLNYFKKYKAIKKYNKKNYNQRILYEFFFINKFLKKNVYFDILIKKYLDNFYFNSNFQKYFYLKKFNISFELRKKLFKVNFKNKSFTKNYLKIKRLTKYSKVVKKVLKKNLLFNYHGLLKLKIKNSNIINSILIKKKVIRKRRSSFNIFYNGYGYKFSFKKAKSRVFNKLLFIENTTIYVKPQKRIKTLREYTEYSRLLFPVNVKTYPYNINKLLYIEQFAFKLPTPIMILNTLVVKNQNKFFYNKKASISKSEKEKIHFIKVLFHQYFYNLAKLDFKKNLTTYRRIVKQLGLRCSNGVGYHADMRRVKIFDKYAHNENLYFFKKEISIKNVKHYEFYLNILKNLRDNYFNISKKSNIFLYFCKSKLVKNTNVINKYSLYRSVLKVKWFLKKNLNFYIKPNLYYSSSFFKKLRKNFRKSKYKKNYKKKISNNARFLLSNYRKKGLFYSRLLAIKRIFYSVENIRNLKKLKLLISPINNYKYNKKVIDLFFIFELRLLKILILLNLSKNINMSIRLIKKGLVYVNGQKVTYPNYLTKIGDIISVKKNNEKFFLTYQDKSISKGIFYKKIMHNYIFRKLVFKNLYFIKNLEIFKNFNHLGIYGFNTGFKNTFQEHMATMKNYKERKKSIRDYSMNKSLEKKFNSGEIIGNNIDLYYEVKNILYSYSKILEATLKNYHKREFSFNYFIFSNHLLKTNFNNKAYLFKQLFNDIDFFYQNNNFKEYKNFNSLLLFNLYENNFVSKNNNFDLPFKLSSFLKQSDYKNDKIFFKSFYYLDKKFINKDISCFFENFLLNTFYYEKKFFKKQEKSGYNKVAYKYNYIYKNFDKFFDYNKLLHLKDKKLMFKKTISKYLVKKKMNQKVSKIFKDKYFFISRQSDYFLINKNLNYGSVIYKPSKFAFLKKGFLLRKNIIDFFANVKRF